VLTAGTTLTALARLDLAATAGSNRVNRRRGWARLFATVSRLGDGWAWYGLGLGLLIAGGAQAVPAVTLMALCGVGGSALYKLLKQGIRRPRPCAIHRELTLTVAPLDRFSFPSGHTLHAVMFAAIATAHAPWLGWVVWPFTALVAASRLILGLHYPTDVIAGAAIGLGLAWAGLTAAAVAGVVM
jgi:undecaprenyl-diphosphatase